jgi:hypothetical protein
VDTIILAALIAAFATLAAVLIQHHLRKRSRISVKRIEDVKDQDLTDLDQALELYEHYLDRNQRDAKENIVRWMNEVREETAQGRCKLRDCLLVAKAGDRVCGFLYAHYYYATQLMFISFLAIDKRVPQARRCNASTALLRFLAQDIRTYMPDCRGIVFEVERPTEGNNRCARRGRARAEHFRFLASTQDVLVREIQFDYMQPCLDLCNPESSEKPHVLMYGRWATPLTGRSIPRAEVARLLGFVYLEIYGDHFEDDPEKDFEYRAYLHELLCRAVKTLPPEVPII